MLVKKLFFASLVLFLVMNLSGSAYSRSALPKTNEAAKIIIIDKGNVDKFIITFKDFEPVKAGETLYGKLKNESGILPGRWSYQAILSANSQIYNINLIYPGKIYRSLFIVPGDGQSSQGLENHLFYIRDAKTMARMIEKAKNSGTGIINRNGATAVKKKEIHIEPIKIDKGKIPGEGSKPSIPEFVPPADPAPDASEPAAPEPPIKDPFGLPLPNPK